MITDHLSLKWLQKLGSPTGRLGRWSFELQQFDFEVHYRKGALNKVSDALSCQLLVELVRRNSNDEMSLVYADAPNGTGYTEGGAGYKEGNSFDTYSTR